MNREWIYKNKYLVVILGFFLLLIVAAPFVPKDKTLSEGESNAKNNVESNKEVGITKTPTIGKKQTITVAPSLIVDAAELVKAYDKNKLAAQEQYTGKTVQITAYIDNISTDVTDKYYLSLRPTNDKYYFGTGISCYFADKSQKAEILALENEQSVTVRGKMADMSLGIVVINDCKIVR